MELHNLKPFQNSKKSKKRVGRGHGSGHGTYSTRGMKGQRARSGGKSGQKRRGMKQIMLRIPKLRGIKSIHPKALVVNVGKLNEMFVDGDTVTPKNLEAKKLVTAKQGGKSVIKILGTGSLQKQLTIEGCTVSESAKKKIEAAKGMVK